MVRVALYLRSVPLKGLAEQVWPHLSFFFLKLFSRFIKPSSSELLNFRPHVDPSRALQRIPSCFFLPDVSAQLHPTPWALTDRPSRRKAGTCMTDGWRDREQAAAASTCRPRTPRHGAAYESLQRARPGQAGPPEALETPGGRDFRIWGLNAG